MEIVVSPVNSRSDSIAGTSQERMHNTSAPYAYQGSLRATDNDGVVRRLLRRKFLFLLVFVTTLGLVASVYFILPRTYKAEAALTVSSPDQVLASQREADGQQTTVGDTADLESQSVILSSPMLLRELLRHPEIETALLSECELSAPAAWRVLIRSWLLLQPYPSCQDQVANTAATVDGLRDQTSVTINGRSRVLTLAFTARSADVAELIANGILQVYLDARTREKLEPRDAAIDWLRDETTRVSGRLRDTEVKVEKFLQASGVIKGQAAPIASEQLTTLAQQLGQAEAERDAAAGRLQQTRLQADATSGILGSRTISDIKEKIASLTADTAQLFARYGNSNPALVEARQQRADLQRLLSQETNVVNRSAQADYEAATSRVDALHRQLDSLKEEVRGNDDATTQVAALQRDADTDRELYVDLIKSLNQIETDRRLITPNARLVNWAEPPQSVFFPKRSIFGLGGVLLATAFATVVALLRDSTDRRIREVTGLQTEADLRVLARIPHVSGLGRSSSDLVSQIQRPSAFQEAVRGLYAECLLVSGKRGDKRRILRTFLITSSERGEGKSFTAIALAHFAASAGLRVLILECDLRRPSIGRSLKLAASLGVSEILRGQVSPAQVVIALNIPNLNVVLAGKTATDSAELLGSKSMTELLTWATTSYDLVVLDTPPSRVLPDARILASSVDGILYCAQWGHSITDSVIQGVQEIKAAGGLLLGLVLGRVHHTDYRLYNMDHPAMSEYPAMQ